MMNLFWRDFRAFRFEDVATNLRQKAEEILQYLDLPLTSNLELYLEKHTKVTHKNSPVSPSSKSYILAFSS